MNTATLLKWAAFIVLGFVLGEAGIHVKNWEFWVVMLCVVVISIADHLFGG